MFDMGFSPCKADPCIWLRKAKCSTKYEYVVIYVDDLLIGCTCTSEFIHTLKRKHSLKIMGGTIFDVITTWTQMAPLLHCLRSTSPRSKTPSIRCSLVKPFQSEISLDKNDHPELDNSELANDDLITKFMCMIGQLQWAVTLGRYDILAHVMSIACS